MPSDRKAKTRVRIAFLFLFVVMAAFSVGVYYVPDLAKLHQSFAARDGQAATPAVAGSRELDEAQRQQPANKFLRMVAMAAKTANETNAASKNCPLRSSPLLSRRSAFWAWPAGANLETLRRDLKTAEANATTFMPRYSALLKAERDNLEKYALSLGAGKDAVGKFLDNIDKRHAETTALISRLLSARADLYRAYENYVAVLTARIRHLQVRRRSFHILASGHGGTLQCRGPCHDGRLKSCR